jgi:hypothetical protein
MTRSKWLAVLVCLALACTTLAASESNLVLTDANVLVTITVDEDEGHERDYRLVARGDSSDSRLLTGWRVPIPSSSFHGQDTPAKLVKSYTYQNVGMTAQLRVTALPGRQLALSGAIEVSAAKEALAATGEDAPTIGTFDQRFNVLLDDGKPLTLAQVSNPEGGTLTIRLRAELLD